MKDLASFQKYYEEYMPKIFRYVFSKVSDRELAEDLVSEISLKAYEHFDSYNEKYPFGGWFYGIARNHLIDHYKRSAKQQYTSLDEVENLIADSSSPLADTIDSMKHAALKAALAKLDDDEKELVTLRYLSGYSYREIGVIFEKEENAVKVATHRAIARLQKILPSYVAD